MPGPLDVDHYFSSKARAGAHLELKLVLAYMMRGLHLLPEQPVAWRAEPSPYMNGLMVAEQAPETETVAPFPADGLIVGTVRMGYGHYRMALAASSWALERHHTPRMLDLLATERDESKVIHRTDALYSRLSRLAAEVGGPVEWAWGRLMKTGDLGTLRASCAMAEKLTALMSGLPREAPIISTFPLNGHIAVACGFERVVNLVFDNDPQYFLVVPHALNLVQSPSAYQRLRRLGVPSRDLAIAGHWVTADIAKNAPRDCELRIKRAQRKERKRLLVSIGGAGAQCAYLTKLFEKLAPRLKDGELKLLVNLGDHRELDKPFREAFDRLGLEHDIVDTWEGLQTFLGQNDLAAPPVSGKPVTMFSFVAHMEAVLATDELVRVADVLVTKPSELAFLPVPKLHIRRVGDHEAKSARRSAELGDGTLECREVEDAAQMALMVTKEPSLAVAMNEAIIANAARGIYDGSRKAVEHALDGARPTTP